MSPRRSAAEGEPGASRARPTGACAPPEEALRNPFPTAPRGGQNGRCRRLRGGRPLHHPGPAAAGRSVGPGASDGSRGGVRRDRDHDDRRRQGGAPGRRRGRPAGLATARCVVRGAGRSCSLTPRGRPLSACAPARPPGSAPRGSAAGAPAPAPHRAASPGSPPGTTCRPRSSSRSRGRAGPRRGRLRAPKGSVPVRAAMASTPSGVSASASKKPSLHPTMSVRASSIVNIDPAKGRGTRFVARAMRSRSDVASMPTLTARPRAAWPPRRAPRASARRASGTRGRGATSRWRRSRRARRRSPDSTDRPQPAPPRAAPWA